MDEVSGVEESTPFTEFPECIADAGEIDGDFWGDEFDVKCDDLLLEDE